MELEFKYFQWICYSTMNLFTRITAVCLFIYSIWLNSNANYVSLKLQGKWPAKSSLISINALPLLWLRLPWHPWGFFHTSLESLAVIKIRRFNLNLSVDLSLVLMIPTNERELIDLKLLEYLIFEKIYWISFRWMNCIKRKFGK